MNGTIMTTVFFDQDGHDTTGLLTDEQKVHMLDCELTMIKRQLCEAEKAVDEMEMSREYWKEKCESLEEEMEKVLKTNQIRNNKFTFNNLDEKGDWLYDI